MSGSFFPRVAVALMNRLKEYMSFTELMLDPKTLARAPQETAARVTHIGVPVQTHRDSARSLQAPSAALLPGLRML